MKQKCDCGGELEPTRPEAMFMFVLVGRCTECGAVTRLDNEDIEE